MRPLECYFRNLTIPMMCVIGFSCSSQLKANSELCFRKHVSEFRITSNEEEKKHLHQKSKTKAKQVLELTLPCTSKMALIWYNRIKLFPSPSKG